ncbi:hypothetical protein L1D58_24135, partial [Vibrio diabolicus]|uniref:hypothetical protein n=1 Tax=Vibrio diabolicus TaxID=50719 RepID=UPI00211ABA1C
SNPNITYKNTNKNALHHDLLSFSNKSTKATKSNPNITYKNTNKNALHHDLLSFSNKSTKATIIFQN